MDDFRTELIRDHAVIEHLANKLSRLIDTDAEPTILADLLAQLVQTVAGHLEVEERMLQSDALRPGAVSAEEVARVTRDFERLKENWIAYWKIWTAEEIATDRAGFLNASRAILPRLQDRVRLETEMLVLAGALKPKDG